MRFKIDFSYSGRDFHGFQKQPLKRTVQSELEALLTSINEKSVKVVAAGRTDAGVNALHQVAHFDLDKEISAYKLKGALNGRLPEDIYINEVYAVDNSFHARYMVKSKTYNYYINLGNYNPIDINRIYQYCKSLDIEKMIQASSFLIGKHDFTTFSSCQDKREDKVREIFDINFFKEKDILIISFKGNGFLKYQIRNMVGTLLQVGEHKIDYNYVSEILSKKDRRLAGNTAPSSGLTLMNIEY